MPGSVPISTPTAVLPHRNCKTVAEQVSWSVVASDPYADGNVQVRSDADAERIVWDVTQYYALNDLSTIESFWISRKGPYEAFYFYPKSSDYDATGISATGRYTVRFDGSMTINYRLGRWAVKFRLITVV